MFSASSGSEQRSFPDFVAVELVALLAQHAGVLAAASEGNIATLSRPVQHRVNAVLLFIPASFPRQRVSLKMTSMTSS